MNVNKAVKETGQPGIQNKRGTNENFSENTFKKAKAAVPRLIWHGLTSEVVSNQLPATSVENPLWKFISLLQDGTTNNLSKSTNKGSSSTVAEDGDKPSPKHVHLKKKLRTSGSLLYESVADQIPYLHFMKEFKMADTFYSWFLITELHVWMLMVRTMAEKEEGRFTRNCMLEAMWEDVTSRAKMINPGDSSAVKEEVHELSQQFQAAMLCYDEGLLSNDKILAGAVWRRFFQKQSNEPEDIECIVRYIRQQIQYLDNLTRRDVLLYPEIKWTDLKRDLPV